MVSALELVRRRIPVALLPWVASVRAARALHDQAGFDAARSHMAFLLERTRPEVDLDACSIEFARFCLLRPEMHRRPTLLMKQAVVGVPHLTDAASRGRGVVLHFLHHGRYDGSLVSLARQGLVHKAVAEPALFGRDLTASRRAYADLFRPFDLLVDASLGSTAFEEFLRSGATLAMATDRPGNTGVEFCGRDVFCSSGAVRVARGANAPIVVLTAERRSGEIIGRLHPAVEPADFPSVQALLQHLLRLHEPSVLAWPSGYVYPLDCWGAAPTRAG